MDASNLSFSLKDLNLQAGDLVFRQNTNKGVEISQKILTKGSKYASATHVGIIVKVTDQAISILQAYPDGIHIKKYTPETFKKYIQNELHVLRNPSLNGELKATALAFAKEYKKDNSKKYAYGHFINCAFQSVKDNTKGRYRTLYSLENNKLMTSEGHERKASICSELASEIVKIAQFSKAVEEHEEANTEKNLKKLQKLGLVLNVNSENISPALLEKKLIKKFNFEMTRITNS
jgi:hypothetical protein